MNAKTKTAVVAIGGNSLIKDSKHQTIACQYNAAGETATHIADMIEAGWNIAIGHGNGRIESLSMTSLLLCKKNHAATAF